MQRTDTQKPIKINSQFRRDGITYIIASFVNCTPKSETCFWDYVLSYKDKKEDKELRVDSNILARNFERV